MDPVSKARSESSQKRRNIHENSLKNLEHGKRFQLGNRANPGGRPKKLHITKMYEQILEKSENRDEIKQSLKNILTEGKMSAVLLIREMADRTEGTVGQEVDVNVTVQYADSVARIRARKKKLESN